MTSFPDAAADWLAGRRGVARAALAFGLGILAALALPPLYGAPLLLVAFPGLIWLLSGVDRARGAFWIGWWFGLGYFMLGLYWISNALLVEGDAFVWLVPLAAAGLPAALAIFTGLSCLAAWGWARASRSDLTLSLVIFWVAGEWLRGHVLTGFPWNLIGASLGFSNGLSQFAALSGAYGLSLLAVLVASLPAMLARRDLTRPAGWTPALAAAGLLAAVWLGGLWRLDNARVTMTPDVRLRLVQANIAQEDKWKPSRRQDNLIAHMRLSERGGQRAITYFIWPETAVPYFIGNEPSRRVLIGRLARPGGGVITGAVRLRRDEAGGVQIWNSVFALAPTGALTGVYDKSHLVPFGEYVPWRAVLTRLGLDKLVPGEVDYSPGPGRRTLHLPGLPPVSPLVCYEVIFPGAVLDPADRPAWLLNLTNDAWYGRSTGPYQHLEMARLRAIEEGLPLVRAAGTGISAVFDPYGRALGRLALGARGVLDSPLPRPLASAPPYSRWKDGVVLVLVLLLGAWSLLLGRKS